jgi:hypothetical protein
VRFCPDQIANCGGIDLGHAGSGSEEFKNMLNKLGTNRIEQSTKADLLAVTLFEDRGEVTTQKDVPACAGGLVPPFHTSKIY